MDPTTNKAVDNGSDLSLHTRVETQRTRKGKSKIPRISAVVTLVVFVPNLFDQTPLGDAYDQRFLRAHTSRAFNLASEWNVDEVSSFSHMRLNFVELLGRSLWDS